MSEAAKTYTAETIAEVIAGEKRVRASWRTQKRSDMERKRRMLVEIVEQLQAESARIRTIIETHGSPMAYPGLINREELLFKIDQGVEA